VLVNPMILRPGETPADLWASTGVLEARIERAATLGYPVEFDPQTYMFHDVAPDVLATATQGGAVTAAVAQPLHIRHLACRSDSHHWP